MDERILEVEDAPGTHSWKGCPRTKVSTMYPAVQFTTSGDRKLILSRRSRQSRVQKGCFPARQSHEPTSTKQRPNPEGAGRPSIYVHATWRADINDSAPSLAGIFGGAGAPLGEAATAEHARSYLKSYPDDGAAWLILGEVLCDVAKYDESAKALRRAIKLFRPDRRDMPYANMGHLYREKGNLRTAERWYRKAVEVNPKVGTSWIFLGAVLAKQGRFAEAKRCHRRAVKLGAGSSDADEAHLNIGLILRAQADYVGALKCFDEAIRLDPNYKAAKEARQDVLEAIKFRKSHMRSS